MTEETRRAAVRAAYDGRCGYCTVHESEAGTELEIDHFQPRSLGGSDDPDNLVYCCTACNRLKGDFWPATDPLTTIRRLLHPKRDDLTEHLREESDGRMVALTATGAFHLDRLRLNRPPLLALRRARRDVVQLRQALADAQAEQAQLRERIAALEGTLQDVLAQIARLLEG
jgi:HNH endonuclease